MKKLLLALILLISTSFIDIGCSTKKPKPDDVSPHVEGVKVLSEGGLLRKENEMYLLYWNAVVENGSEKDKTFYLVCSIRTRDNQSKVQKQVSLGKGGKKKVHGIKSMGTYKPNLPMYIDCYAGTKD